MKIFKEGTILERRGNRLVNNLNNELFNISCLFLSQNSTSSIRINFVNNLSIETTVNRAQDMIISSYDKPGYFYVENNRLNKLFIKI
jgi:hypothetical protein